MGGTYPSLPLPTVTYRYLPLQVGGTYPSLPLPTVTYRYLPLQVGGTYPSQLLEAEQASIRRTCQRVIHAVETEAAAALAARGGGDLCARPTYHGAFSARPAPPPLPTLWRGRSQPLARPRRVVWG